MAILLVTMAIVLVLALLDVPLGLALLGACLVGIAMSPGVPLFLLVQKTVEGMQSFPLLAIPFFLFAGEVMTEAQITERGVDVFNSWFGRLRGALAYGVVGANVFMSGISGSAVADAAATGGVLIPAMKRAGYRPEFAAALCAVSGTIGPIIPPSIAMVIYGVVANVSILKLFVAGYLPGLLLATLLAGYVAVRASRNNFPSLPAVPFRQKLRTTGRGFWALITPVLLVGGIFGGVFTVTELGAVLVAYVFVIGLVVHQALKVQSLPRLLTSSSLTTSNVMFAVGISSVLAYLYTISGVPETLPGVILGITHNSVVILLLMNLVFLVAGTFLDSTPATIILVPILLPLAEQIGVNPIHFGVIVVFNLMIGLVHPPVAISLYVTSEIAGTPFMKSFVAALPMILLMLAALLVVTFVPALSLWLPQRLG